VIHLKDNFNSKTNRLLTRESKSTVRSKNKKEVKTQTSRINGLVGSHQSHSF